MGHVSPSYSPGRKGADGTHQGVKFRTRFSHLDSIRGRFRLTRNSSHGSDSTGSAGQEIEFFYPEVDSKKWGQEEKSNFEQGNIAFDLNSFMHKPSHDCTFLLQTYLQLELVWWCRVTPGCSTR